jgi:hypothetical protein
MRFREKIKFLGCNQSKEPRPLPQYWKYMYGCMQGIMKIVEKVKCFGE